LEPPPDELDGPDFAGPDEAAGAALSAEELGCGDGSVLGEAAFGADVLGADVLGADVLGADVLGADVLGAAVLGVDALGAETLGAETLGVSTGTFGTDTAGSAACALATPTATQTIVTTAAKRNFLAMSGAPERVDARKSKPRAWSVPARCHSPTDYPAGGPRPSPSRCVPTPNGGGVTQKSKVRVRFLCAICG
jgi:hypothetical protein